MELEKFRIFELENTVKIYGGARFSGNAINALQGQVAYTTDTGD